MKKLTTLLALVLVTATSQAAITWYWAAVPSDTAIRDQIAASMNTAVANYNTYSNYNANIPVRYVPGVPTAQASWGGEIQFGGSRNARVAQHEMSHWLACGGHSGWTAIMTGGSWDGIYANSKIQAYDGTPNVSGDTQHFWPYGWNYDSEASWPQRNIGIVGGLRRDMGLTDSTIGMAGSTFDPYKLQNRANAKCLDSYGATVNGTEAVVAVRFATSCTASSLNVSVIDGTTAFPYTGLVQTSMTAGIRVNSINALVCTTSNTNSCTNAGSIAIAAGDFVNFYAAGQNNTSPNAVIRFSATCQ